VIDKEAFVRLFQRVSVHGDPHPRIGEDSVRNGLRVA